ncbi:apolipoprotein N-acyltransferase [Oceaniferula spumae]|uniref:Apolipoprotein N-acyltransferase n=1 Tax=Oceaniferula spumae TaxID=2979115 RepID=A0AAT9FSC0_9BACT
MNIGIRLLLVIVSAGLGILVFPPYGMAAFAVIAWVPLLFALRDAKPSQAMYLGLLHGGIFYGVTMSWLRDVFASAPHMVVPLVMIMALFTAFFNRGYVIAQKRYGAGWASALFASCWWLTMEFYRSEIFYLKFPWMTPGTGLGPTCISPVLGVSGASFFLILAAALICQKKRHIIAGAILMVGLLVAPIIQNHKASPENTSVRIAAVQSEGAMIEEYMELTRTVTSEGEKTVDVIIWPEYALPFDIKKNVLRNRQLSKFAKETDAVMVVGTQTAAPDDAWRNTALTLDGESFLGEHYKNHTVHFFDDGLAGTEAKAVQTVHGKIGTPICFDSDYQDVIRRMTKDGAEFFAIPSMDAIHWGEMEHYQHAELFRHRAAENGRWIAVAATSGMTQVIDPNGNRVVSIPIIDEGVLTAEIGKDHRLTIYTRIGWLFPWIITCAGAVWMIALAAAGVISRRRDRLGDT